MHIHLYNIDNCDTNYIDECIEKGDLTEFYFKKYKDRLSVVLTDKDNKEKDVCDQDSNWIMEQGIQDANISLPLENWGYPLPNTSKGGGVVV